MSLILYATMNLDSKFLGETHFCLIYLKVI